LFSEAEAATVPGEITGLVKQNIYDNPDFFAGYKALRQNNAGLNEVLEQPALRSLLPDLGGMRALDLGCGAGELCRELRGLGASTVTGVDISSRMLALAQADTDEGITYVNSAIEDYTADAGAFDLVVSSLAFHYVRDFDKIVSSIAGWLVAGGCLVFSVEHPVTTAAQGILPGWHLDAESNRQHWMLDYYQDEGQRRCRWFVDGVIKYHRTTATILNTLLEGGFSIRRILEPYATERAEAERPRLAEERRRPPFLMVKAQRT
jgi:SAM-dependent methyltransferase